MMLCKKSSRWAGAKALLLLPLTAVALGAFAETAYVFPEDKGKKENVTIHIEGRTFPSDKQQPLILVDGKVVKALDEINPSRIATITVLKDSTSIVKYGEEGKYGVVLVTLKKGDGSDHEAQISELKGKIVKIATTNGDGQPEVQVVGYSTKPKNGTVDSMKVVVINGEKPNVHFSGVKGNPAYIVDGVQVSEIESLQPSGIMSISVAKGPGTPRELADKGYDGVITITTKRAGMEAQKAAVNALKSRIETGATHLEAARKGLEQAREYMTSDTWQQAQQALIDAEKELGNAQKNSEVRGIATGVGMTRVNSKAAEPEGSVTVYKGRVTLDGGLPDDLLIYINGKRASKKEVEQLKEGKIKRMEVYKGDEAVKRYGDEGRNGVVEIRARK